MASFGFKEQTCGRPSVPIRLVRAAALALLIGFVNLTLVSPVFGQGAGASVEGVVKDEQGGVLPGVTVTLRNLDSGVTRTSTTQPDGRYRFLALAPGRYHLSAQLSGFASKEVGDIQITIGLSVTQDFTMGVQAVQESVTVTGEAPTVDTTKSEVAGVVTQQQIQTLPVNSRQFLNLALLMPGTSQDAARSFYNNVTIGAGTSFYSNGFLVDGVNNTWAEEGEPRQNFPQGAVQEFKVNTAGFPAEFGLATGGLVQVVTKSGSNRWSGEGFEYFRDKSLNALNTFEQQRHDQFGDPKPDFRRNQYGASLGGPIIQNRTHFFVSIEHTKTDQPITVSTGKPQFYSALEGTFPAPVTSTLFVGRLDHQFNPDQTLFFRIGAEGGKKTCLGCGGTGAANAGFDFQKPAHSSVVGHTWVVSPTLLNEIRFQYAYAEYQVIPGGQQPFTTVGDYPPERISIDRIQRSLYLPSLSYGNGFDEIGPEKRYQFKDTVTLSHEKHSVKLGVDFSHIPFADDALYNLNGYYVFGTDQFLDGSPQSIANLTSPTFFGASVPAVNSSLPTQHLALFVQDTWRPVSNVTVNFGLRYDRQFGSFNEDITLDPRVVAAVEALGSTANNKSRGDKNNFGPRVGVVWDPGGNGNTVVRAGFGIYYDNIRTLNNMIGEQRNFSQFTIAIVNPPYPDPYQGQDPLTFASTAPANLNVLADNFRNPQAENYSAGLTQKLTAEMSIHVDGVYVHSSGDRIKYDLNLPNPATGIRPLPQYGFIDQDRSILSSDYKAMFVRLDKRLSHHYTYLVSYTLAKADDVGSRATNNGGFFHVTDQSNPSLDEGPADSDRRHSLVASGTVLLPWEMTLGAVWTYRSAAPFSAYSANFSADGQRQYVPGTSRNQGNRDLDLAAVNAYRAQNALGPVDPNQIQTDRYSSVDVRFSKAIQIAGQTKLELIAQVFNILGTDNLNAPFSGGQVTNALSSSFGMIQTAKNRQQGELAVRFIW
jgi:Carboxypeptidase regulatory-like domain